MRSPAERVRGVASPRPDPGALLLWVQPSHPAFLRGSSAEGKRNPGLRGGARVRPRGVVQFLSRSWAPGPNLKRNSGVPVTATSGAPSSRRSTAPPRAPRSPAAWTPSRESGRLVGFQGTSSRPCPPPAEVLIAEPRGAGPLPQDSELQPASSGQRCPPQARQAEGGHSSSLAQAARGRGPAARRGRSGFRAAASRGRTAQAHTARSYPSPAESLSLEVGATEYQKAGAQKPRRRPRSCPISRLAPSLDFHPRPPRCPRASKVWLPRFCSVLQEGVEAREH